MPKTFGVATAAGKVEKVVADEFRVEPTVIKGEADAQTAYVFYTVGKDCARLPRGRYQKGQTDVERRDRRSEQESQRGA